MIKCCDGDMKIILMHPNTDSEETAMIPLLEILLKKKSHESNLQEELVKDSTLIRFLVMLHLHSLSNHNIWLSYTSWNLLRQKLWGLCQSKEDSVENKWSLIWKWIWWGERSVPQQLDRLLTIKIMLKYTKGLLSKDLSSTYEGGAAAWFQYSCDNPKVII